MYFFLFLKQNSAMFTMENKDYIQHKPMQLFSDWGSIFYFDMQAFGLIYQGSHLNFRSRIPGLLLFQKYESHLKNRSPNLKKWSPKDFNMKFYPKKPYQLNSNLTRLVRILC